MASPLVASSPGSTPPPPLELVRDSDSDTDEWNIVDDDDSQSDSQSDAPSDGDAPRLATQLAPWLHGISPTAVHWAPLPTHGGRLGVAVELCADVTDDASDEGDEFENLLQLREAVDLVLLALAVEPAALRALLRKRVSWWERGLLIEEDAIESVLSQGVRTELRLRLEFRSIKTRLLVEELAPRFIGPVGARLSDNGMFRQLRASLLERLRADKAALAHVSGLSVPVTIDLDSGSVEQISLLDADDFFVHLTQFSDELKTTRRSAASPPWQVATQPAPLDVNAIDLTLRRFCITHRVTQAAKAFMAADTTVRVKQLNLDPRFISCANSDVRDFVATLTAGATELRIDTGVDPEEEFPEPIDEHSEDRRDSIRVILGAVNKVKTIKELNFGGLFTLCVAPRNRRVVWQYFFGHILSRDVVPETITFEDQIILEREDADACREEAAQWRAQHPDRKLLVKTLNLRLHSTESDTIEQLLLAIDDVESIEVNNRDGANLSTRILYRLLSFPSLKRLKIERLTVPSMEIFDPSIYDPDLPTKPLLEELAVDDLNLLDVSSMPRFLEKLRWDVQGRNALATTLQRLSVAQNIYRWEDLYIWDRAALEALDRALTSNRALREVRALMDYGDAFYGECSTRLAVHNRCPLPAAASVRKSATVTARKLAFLSTIRSGGDSARNLLDAAAVSRILEFAAPHVMRKVELCGWDSW